MQQYPQRLLTVNVCQKSCRTSNWKQARLAEKSAPRDWEKYRLDTLKLDFR